MGVPMPEKASEDPLAFVQRLQLPFNDLRLLTRALTHRSYRNENPEALEDNERLEFLGDAVLDFLVGAWLYDKFPEMREGELTRLRSSLVRTEQLASFAREIHLGKAMRLGRGEVEGGGRQRPGLLCATFEALIGAMYLDCGLPVVQSFIESRLSVAADQILFAHRQNDPKSLLQEVVQASGFGHPVYKTIHTHGPDHEKIFEVEVLVDGRIIGHGRGSSKQAAAKAAADDALSKMD